MDLVFSESESNVRHQRRPWFGAFGHLLAWRSGVLRARFLHLGDASLDLVFNESESNVRHRPCPWCEPFGHLLAWCSGVLRAHFLASWGYHSGPCFLRIRKGSGTSWHGVLVWYGRIFLASWGYHSGSCFLRIRKQR